MAAHSVQKEYEQLFSSAYDFKQANFCACYLLKKRWHAFPWERRGTVYQQQTAFVTNLVIAYARPFTKSKGWSGFPERLCRFDSEQSKFHKNILELRNQVFAHSDSQHFRFDLCISEDFETTIEGVPMRRLSVEQVECTRDMTGKLIKAVEERLEQLRRELRRENP